MRETHLLLSTIFLARPFIRCIYTSRCFCLDCSSRLSILNLSFIWPLTRLLLIVTTGLFTHYSQALDFSNLTGLNNKPQYEITIASGDKSLKKLLEKELSDQRKQNRQLKFYKTPHKIAQYEKRLLNKRLRSEGYYAAQISSQATEEQTSHKVNSGPLYTISEINWQLPTKANNHFKNSVRIGDPLKAPTILKLQKDITHFIERNYCYYQVKVTYDATVYHQSHSAKLTLALQPSTETQIQSVQFSGLKTIKSEYLSNRIDLNAGSCYQKFAINQARLELFKTNLLSNVDIQDDGLQENGVDLTINVKERNHRSISVGGGFRSEEGLGLTSRWQHRNLWGKAEQANIDFYISSPRQTLSGELILPHYRRANQTLTFHSDLTQEDTDAFESNVLSSGVTLSRKLTQKLRADLGIQLDFSQVEEDNNLEEFALPSLPFNIEYDSRNAPLDAKKGWVASLGVQPFWNLYERDTRFLKVNAATSVYKTFNNAVGRPTFAARAAIGSISGAGRASIPANERFYVGGGGSVRGYAYQTLGPLTDNEPDGGLSFSEYSFEGRFHWGDNWGSVVFVDGGSAYREKLPSVDEKLFWGAGVGLRYYTSFAPIRFDIAVPLDKRDEIDDSFQIYISIGQAY